MGLWVAFGFGALVGAFIGVLIGRLRTAQTAAATPTVAPPAAQRFAPPEVQHVVLDEGSANVLNALNNRLAAIGALADLLQGSPLDPERARALMMLHGEVRRAAEITQHFLELAQHPIGAAEPSDCSIVLNGVLAEREGTLKELGVKLVRNIPHDLPMVACPMAQLTEMLMKLLDFALRRLRDSQPPRELRVAVIEAGPSLTISLWDSGTPLSVEAEQRLVTPFRFTQSAGGGEIEFALARALAQSSGGTLRLRPRPGGGAEVVVTLPKSVLAPLARATAATPSLPQLPVSLYAEASPHPGLNRLGGRQQLGARPTQIHRRERRARRDPRSTPAVAFGKARVFDEPRRRDLHHVARRKGRNRARSPSALPAPLQLGERRPRAHRIHEERARGAGVGIGRIEHHRLSAAQREHRLAHQAHRVGGRSGVEGTGPRHPVAQLGIAHPGGRVPSQPQRDV